MGRGPGFAERTRQDILKRRRKVRAGGGRLKAVPKPKPKRDPKKTALMLLIERDTGIPIEVLISKGEIADVGRDLDIDPSTVSKWRLRFGIR